MLDEIKKSSFRVKWNLREIHKIIQWKEGCVYRTKSLGIISCSHEYAKELTAIPNIFVGSVSTRISKELNG